MKDKVSFQVQEPPTSYSQGVVAWLDVIWFDLNCKNEYITTYRNLAERKELFSARVGALGIE